MRKYFLTSVMLLSMGLSALAQAQELAAPPPADPEMLAAGLNPSKMTFDSAGEKVELYTDQHIATVEALKWLGEMGDYYSDKTLLNITLFCYYSHASLEDRFAAANLIRVARRLDGTEYALTKEQYERTYKIFYASFGSSPANEIDLAEIEEDPSYARRRESLVRSITRDKYFFYDLWQIEPYTRAIYQQCWPYMQKYLTSLE